MTCQKIEHFHTKKVRENARKCHNHKPQPFPETKRKRKQTKPNKPKLNKRGKSTKISSLFPKQGNCNARRTEKHKNKLSQKTSKDQVARQVPRHRSPEKGKDAECTHSSEIGTIKMDRPCYKNA